MTTTAPASTRQSLDRCTALVFLLLWSLVGCTASYQVLQPLSAPAGLAVDGSGQVWLADRNNGRVVQLASNGSLVAALSSPLLSSPFGVGLGLHGEVIVSDSFHAYLVVFQGGLPAAYTVNPPHLFSSPQNVAVDSAGAVYVADAGRDAVFKVDLNGTSLVNFTHNLSAPQGVAVDSAGVVYVSDFNNWQVVVFSASGAFLRAVSSPASAFNGYPTGLCVDSASTVYFASLEGSRTVVKVTSSGAVSVFSTVAADEPVGIAVDASGRVFLSDSGNGRVLLLSSAGTTAQVYSTGSASLASAVGIAVDAAGNIYLADPDSSHSPIRTSALGMEVSTCNVDWAHGVALDAAGYAYATDWTTSSTLKLASNCSTLAAFTSSQATSPNDVAVDDAGNVYVSSNDVVVMFGPGGQVLSTFTTSNPAMGAWGVAADHSGRLYIADRQNGRVVSFTGAGATPTFLTGLLDPCDVAVDSDNNLYIAEVGASQVTKRSAINYTLLATFITTNPTLGSRQSTSYLSLAVDVNHTVFVTDNSRGRVVVFTQVGPGSPSAPERSSSSSSPAIVASTASGVRSSSTTLATSTFSSSTISSSFISSSSTSSSAVISSTVMPSSSISSSVMPSSALSSSASSMQSSTAVSSSVVSSSAVTPSVTQSTGVVSPSSSAVLSSSSPAVPSSSSLRPSSSSASSSATSPAPTSSSTGAPAPSSSPSPSSFVTSLPPVSSSSSPSPSSLSAASTSASASTTATSAPTVSSAALTSPALSSSAGGGGEAFSSSSPSSAAQSLSSSTSVLPVPPSPTSPPTPPSSSSPPSTAGPPLSSTAGPVPPSSSTSSPVASPPPPPSASSSSSSDGLSGGGIAGVVLGLLVLCCLVVPATMLYVRRPPKATGPARPLPELRFEYDTGAESSPPVLYYFTASSGDGAHTESAIPSKEMPPAYPSAFPQPSAPTLSDSFSHDDGAPHSGTTVLFPSLSHSQPSQLEMGHFMTATASNTRTGTAVHYHTTAVGETPVTQPAGDLSIVHIHDGGESGDLGGGAVARCGGAGTEPWMNQS